jgi:hypothetical protein
LHAHEEGRLVFFCGAGVSYPAGLPGYEKLVQQIYKLNETTFSEIERGAFDRGQYDASLDLLERRYPGQRMAIRSKLGEALKPKSRRKGAFDTHAALLHLSRSRDGAFRLVTTNFDHNFHKAAKRLGQKFQSYTAPMLPIPKNSRWDGLVFLHGLLPEKPNDTALNRLVLTSGDFGLAYLTERWAARFVSELFRNYVVCFVGYSIEDPVLRYMMDALAADRMLGEVTQQAWALGDCEPGQEHIKTTEWKAKGVTPILYSVPVGSNDHSALHRTLQTWAKTYRDGVQGKEAIVVQHALARPQESTQQDNFVERMLWALSDKTGLPAKRFADFNPVPSLDWLLDAFSQASYGPSDLPRFGIQPSGGEKNELRYSLIQRPAGFERAAPMLIAYGGNSSSQWDNVMYQLARWLVRHLNDPRLLIWIAERGGQIHVTFAKLIESTLDKINRLEKEKSASELDEIRLYAPNAIPSAHMRIIWRLLISGRIKSNGLFTDLYAWVSRFKKEGLTATMRLELRELLAPKIVLKKRFPWMDDNFSSTIEPSPFNYMADWELALNADHVKSALPDLSDEQWTMALPLLLQDFDQLLRDALDLLHDLGGSDEHIDFSHLYLPSITPHWQNRGYRDWVSLIELLRDAWLALNKIDSTRAAHIAQGWFDVPYPAFKRLALFAASQNGCIAPDKWLNWLIQDDARWLWSDVTMREVYRLLVQQGMNLAVDAQQNLETIIIAGPPRKLYKDNLDEENWQNFVAHTVWLHLSKLKTSGLVLGKKAAAHLAEISVAHPKWQLEKDERDEFSHWMSGTGDPDYEVSRDVDIAPRTRSELALWLSKPIPNGRPLYEDTWREVCRTRFFHCLFALCDLAKQNVWPIGRWREALQTWTEDELVLRSWRYAAPIVLTMPDETLQQIIHAVTPWVEAASKSYEVQEDNLLKLCNHVLNLPIDPSTGIKINGAPIDQPVIAAINHPIGHITRALINLWFKDNPKDNDLIPSDLKSSFSKICDVSIETFRHGRVLLCSQLIAFFRVDRLWTEQHLLPLFNWSNPNEAKAVWEGFLMSPRFYQPLSAILKPHFMETAKHYETLGEHQRQFAAYLTYTALERPEGYSTEELRTALSALPQEGLEEAAYALVQALEGAADQREDYWRNRVQPFWQNIWPKSSHFITQSINESLSRLVIAARGEFPLALNAVKGWLQPIKHQYNVVRLLRESMLCIRYPSDALFFLNAVIDIQKVAPPDLVLCLQEIIQADPKLAQDARYIKLLEYTRRYDS